jgi:hypothetical protein
VNKFAEARRDAASLRKDKGIEREQKFVIRLHSFPRQEADRDVAAPAVGSRRSDEFQTVDLRA